jgi:hypothetical protein
MGTMEKNSAYHDDNGRVLFFAARSRKKEQIQLCQFCVVFNMLMVIAGCFRVIFISIFLFPLLYVQSCGNKE